MHIKSAASTVDSPLNLGPAQLANRNSAWELKFSASAYRANYVSCIIAKAISIHYILQAIHIFSREHYPEDLCLPLCFRSGFHFHGIFGQFFSPHFYAFKVQLHFSCGQTNYLVFLQHLLKSLCYQCPLKLKPKEA